MLKKYLKYHRLLKKIHNKLPRHDPENGDMLKWSIEIGHYSNRGYDCMSGDPIDEAFVPKVKATQIAPKWLRGHSKAYRYNFAKKCLVEIGKWRY